MAKDFAKIRKIPGVSQETTQLQSNIDRLANEIQQEPVMRGVLLKDQSIGTSNTVINHGLGRAYQGFIVARLNADARIWESATSSQPATQIILRASAACTASIWVY